MDLLRFTTAGSVDDGKSTLIGRLLHDAKSIFEDQYEALEQASRAQGGGVNLALLTDGLRAEREQGITIDVAYRYFATPRRKFIIADTPGHEQYTRNMVTGASTAELAVILIDAQQGVLTQSRRHGFLASLLQIPHLVVAVNKMDLVGYDEAVFRDIVAAYQAFAEQLEIEDITYLPLSALLGDNVVEPSDHMPWYRGGTLLHHLETVKVGAERNVIDFRFPVQYVLRPHQGYRGFAGEVASGTVRVGDEVTVLPSRRTTRVAQITAFEATLQEAGPGTAVALTLEDAVDVSRGDLIVRTRNQPDVVRSLDADLCWMDASPFVPGKRYLLRHTTREVQAFAAKIVYRLDVDTLHRAPARALGLNDIGRVELEVAEPLFVDPYRVNRYTGSFVLIDPDTLATAGAGMIRGAARDVPPVTAAAQPAAASPNVVWEGLNISRAEREAAQPHRAAVVWLTGLSGSGKTTIARAAERRLFDRGCLTMLLDGDVLRHGLNADLGFGPTDRDENIRRAGEVARLFFEQGAVVLCAFISPYAEGRRRARSLLPEGRFVEVHVACSVAACEARDPKGLYARARAGDLPHFTGISAPYEPPADPELVLDTEALDVDACVDRLLTFLENKGIVS